MYNKRFVLYKRLTPLIVILFFTGILYYLGISNHITLKMLHQQQEWIFQWIQIYPISSFFIFFALYVGSICLFLPASSLLCFLSGMAYHLPYAIFLGMFSETMGAFLLFLLFRFSTQIPQLELHKKSTWQKAEKTFQKGPISYLLFFRISHLIPYWIINALAATLKTKIWTFLWTTSVGVLPFVILMAETGRTLKQDFFHNPHFHKQELFSTEAQLVLVGIALIAFIPLGIKKILSLRQH